MNPIVIILGMGVLAWYIMGKSKAVVKPPVYGSGGMADQGPPNPSTPTTLEYPDQGPWMYGSGGYGDQGPTWTPVDGTDTGAGSRSSTQIVRDENGGTGG